MPGLLRLGRIDPEDGERPRTTATALGQQGRHRDPLAFTCCRRQSKLTRWIRVADVEAGNGSGLAPMFGG